MSYFINLWNNVLDLFRLDRNPDKCNTYDRPKDEEDCKECCHDCDCDDWVG